VSGTPSLSIKSNIWLVAGAVVLSALTAAAIYYLRSPLPLAVLPAVLLVFYAFPRALSNPIPVLAGFLLVAVNLNFLRFGGPALNADVILSALFVWALLIRFGIRGKYLGSTLVERAYLIFLAATFVSVLLSVSPAQSFKRWARDFQYLILISFLIHYMMTNLQRQWLIKAVVLSSIIPCAVGFAGLYFSIPDLLGAPAPLGEGRYIPRMAGTTSHPVTLSLYLAVVATLTTALILDGRLIRRRLTIPLLALQLVSLFLSYGRTGWGAFVVSLAALLWLSGRRKVLFLAAPVILAALWSYLPEFRERWNPALEATHENSLLWRVGLWIHALGVFQARPIFGSGPGTFTDYVSYQKGYAAHQTWVGRLVETGVVGTVALLFLLLVVGRELWLRHRTAGVKGDLVLKATLASWVGLMAASFASDGFGLPSVILYFWTIAGISLRSKPFYESSHSTRRSSFSYEIERL
jgi:O-antigen ligase